MTEQPGEGWYRPGGATRWHYFRHNYSLCGHLKAGPFDELVPGEGFTQWTCKACGRSLAKGLKVNRD